MKMKIIISAVVLALSLNACIKDVINGSGPQVTEQRNVSNYTAIDLQLNATIHYTEADTFSMEIIAQQNILNEISTDVNDGKLIIRLPWDTKIISYDAITINISAPAVSDFTISGSGNIFSSNMLHVLNSDFNISGSGKIAITSIETNDIDARISGSGKLEVNGGNSTNADITISGSGNADIENVLCEHVKTTTSGSGDCRVYASNTLDVKISGSGKVYYAGNPTITKNISGSGKLIQL